MIDRTFLSLLVAARVSDPWYDNSWLIGIATGLASGILLAMATPIVLRMRRARKRAVEGERRELAEEIHTPAPSSSPGSATFGSPLHLGSGDINQAARDIHTHHNPTSSARSHGSEDPSTDQKGHGKINEHE
jgi:hypothetical protein